MTASANADSFDVTLNTSSLSGTQTILFGITDGDGVADNSLALSSFNFGGGSAEGSASITGSGITGNLTSGIALDDSGFSALFEQQFTAGSSLSFLLNTSDVFAGGTPDAFAMYVCNSDVSVCYSDDMSTGALLVLNLTGGTLTPSGFVLNGASDQNLPAPVVTVATSSTAAPEPSSLLLIGCGLLGFAAVKKVSSMKEHVLNIGSQSSGLGAGKITFNPF
jgi:hypothetical protein